MGKVVLIVGPHGVGKTSLIDYARKKNEVAVYEGFKISNQNYDLNDNNDFLAYQQQYLKKASMQSRKIHNSNRNGFVLRSIEECSFYYFLREESDLMNEYYKIVRVKEYMGADIIIYLDASYEILQLRCRNDQKRDKRKTDLWYQEIYSKYDKYWKNYPDIVILDTSKENIPDLYKKIKEICDERPICFKK